MDRGSVIVIDNGTGYTKMGYSGDSNPQFIIPTVMAETRDDTSNSNIKGIPDLDYTIGYDALETSKTYTLHSPLKHGLVANWELMERYHQACIYHYLRCDPEDHYFLLTEPPMNTPENREYTAEIFFESFGAKGLYIGIQAILSLVAGWSKNKSTSFLTGTIIDSGDGVTHVVPVVEGYVISSAIKSIPIAGKDITYFIQHLLREREPNIPPGDAMEVAKHIKENYCYVSPDMAQEFTKYDTPSSPNILKASYKDNVTKKPYTIDVGFERFLGPEVFFSPEIYNQDFTKSLPQIIDQSIQTCPIDTRRALYGNMVLSGGSTMFKGINKRIQRDVKKIAEGRLRDSTEKNDMFSRTIDVNVISHKRQKYAVWFGGSILADTRAFYESCNTREQYMEYGPSIAKYNKIFTSLL